MTASVRTRDDLTPETFGQALRLCGKFGDLCVCLAPAFQLPLTIKGKVLRLGARFRLVRTDRAAATEHDAPELLQLPIEQLARILHHDEASERELVLEDVEQDRGQPVEFLDLGIGEVVFRGRDIDLADIVCGPSLQTHVRRLAIGALRHDLGWCIEVTAQTRLAWTRW